MKRKRHNFGDKRCPCHCFDDNKRATIRLRERTIDLKTAEGLRESGL